MHPISRTASAVSIALAIAFVVAAPARAGEAVSLTHVHGLSYSADGARLMIPSHNGLAIFDGKRWSKAAGPAHDYMGFSATRDALYSSGHPAPGTGLTNPFGLIKSRDGGQSWSKLGLEGESDFHALATSWGTNAVYVVNHAANSRMSQAGIYFTANDGLKWTRAAAQGLGGDLKALAVHPTDAATVAAGTADGLYVSHDSAGRFERLVSGRQVLAASFSLDGKSLWFSGYAGTATLMRIALKPGASPEALPMPALSEDAVAYIAQNPAHPQEIAIATFKRSVLLSKDAGRTWSWIARGGVTNE
ncbi:MAG: glycosyl hydrolase [Rubrivivax sp. SCN 70-15]|nr:MAG: glycosyl hydrolase [Rubrivivax sp. SCN 70-15]